MSKHHDEQHEQARRFIVRQIIEKHPEIETANQAQAAYNIEAIAKELHPWDAGIFHIDLDTDVDGIIDNYRRWTGHEATGGRPQLHYGDFGKDQDDEVAAVLTAALHRAGILEHRGTVANLHPAEQRARLALATYQSVGHNVDVAVGTNCGDNTPAKEYEFNAPYLQPWHRVWATGCSLFHKLAERHGDTRIDLVLMSGMTDAAELVTRHEKEFRNTVNAVTLMSGVEPRRDGQRHLVPDHTANNEQDYAAAKHLYAKLQEFRIPLTIVTRNAAVAAALPASFYDTLAATGHPVGARLANAQQHAIQHLWEQCHVKRLQPWGPVNNPRTPEWFRKTFCNGGGEGLTGEDWIWPAVTHLAQYDSLAVVASIPSLRERFFDAQKVRERGTTHRIIGASPEDHGVKNPAALRTFIIEHTRALLVQQAANAGAHSGSGAQR